ncbi:hypothetical protein [Phaeovulum sp. W22_SRMD_FR3]|uniref:hypothetical protein n=1 Tax=Phaeovulum sp. W22_SRMD_FR3 TaxID=3240274 RepID=UPI003F958CE9
MALTRESDIHKRRFGRNMGLGAVLLAFVVLVFGMTIVKVEHGAQMEAFDHQPRASELPRDPVPAAPQVSQ